MPPKPVASNIDQFINVCSQAAQKLGVKLIVIAVQDVRGESKVVASPGAIEALRTAIADKFGFVDGGETAWE